MKLKQIGLIYEKFIIIKEKFNLYLIQINLILLQNKTKLI